MRWLVERPPGDDHGPFEDVGAAQVEIVDGCLVFSDGAFLPPTYILAAGQWISVCEAAE